MKTLDHLRTMNVFGLARTLQVAAEHRLGYKLSPDEADAVLNLVETMRELRKRRMTGNMTGAVRTALTPFEDYDNQ